MQLTQNDVWASEIQSKNDTISYYIEAEANNGKTITRPITGAKGAWKFYGLYIVATNDVIKTPSIEISKIYPNPANAITCVEIQSEAVLNAEINLLDINGRLVEKLGQDNLESGVNRYFFDASLLESGIYIIELKAKGVKKTSRVVVIK
jgi:hypothetical protein